MAGISPSPTARRRLPSFTTEHPLPPPPLGPRAILAALALGWGWLLVHGPLLDLQIYRMGAWSLLGGDDGLYAVADPASGLVFTYSPFAAAVFTPLAALPEAAAAILLTAASVIALARCTQLIGHAVRIRNAHRNLMLYSAFLLEPVVSTLSFGQINMILMWLVLEDLHRPGRRGSGLAIGLAAGIKVVPGIWIVFLVLDGRFRAARTAAGTTAGTAVLGWLVLPGSSAAFWFGGALDPERTGGIGYLANQSITGLVARFADPATARAHWHLTTALVVLVGSTVALRCIRSGRPGESMVAMALTGLLASPISWSHHWVWVLPIIGLMLGSGRTLLASMWVAVAVCWTIWWAPAAEHREHHWSWWQQLCGNAYALLGLLTVATLCTSRRTRQLRPRRVPSADRRPGRRHPRSPRTTGSDRPVPPTSSRQRWRASSHRGAR